MDTPTPAAEAADTPAQPLVIESWEQLDAVMGECRQLEARLAGIDARHDRIIQAAQARKAERARPFADQKKALEAACLAFLMAHEAEINPKAKGKLNESGRSRKLVNGTVGTRFSAVKIKLASTAAATIVVLRGLGRMECIKIEESIINAELKKLPPAELARAGVTLARDKSFFVELAESPVVEYPKAAK